MGGNLHFCYICLTRKCPPELPTGTPLYADYGHAGRSARQPHRNIATSHESVKGCTSIPHMQKRVRRAVSVQIIRGLHIQGNMAYPSVETPRFARRELPHAPAYGPADSLEHHSPYVGKDRLVRVTVGTSATSRHNHSKLGKLWQGVALPWWCGFSMFAWLMSSLCVVFYQYTRRISSLHTALLEERWTSH